MLFCPKVSKFKKYQKGSYPNRVKNNWSLDLNKNQRSIKLISSSFGNITAKQLVAIRFLIKKVLKKKSLVIFKIFPQKAVTKKPLEIRMGKGKGSFAFWTSNIKSGITICEIFCKQLYRKKVIRVLRRAQIRLPIKTKIKL